MMMKIGYDKVFRLVKDRLREENIKTIQAGHKPLSHSEWAKRLGMSQPSLHNWLNYPPKTVDIKTLLGISKCLDIPIPELLDLDDEAYQCFVVQKNMLFITGK